MISRGQIYFASLDPIQGREQSGRRPVLVVSSNAINRQPLVIPVIVGTDAAHIQRDYPTNIRVTAAESHLPVPGYGLPRLPGAFPGPSPLQWPGDRLALAHAHGGSRQRPPPDAGSLGHDH